MSFRKYRLSKPIDSRNAGVSYHSSTSIRSPPVLRFIRLNNVDRSANKAFLDNGGQIETIQPSTSPPRWWTVLPCLILIILVSAADPLLMNDLIIRRYERYYGLEASAGSQSRVCKQSMATPPSGFYYQFPPMNPMPQQNHPGYTAVQHAAASFHTKNSVVALVPALVTFLFLGANCDYIGRRPLLILPLIGKVVWYSLMLIIVSRNLSDAWLLAAHAIEAVFGSSGLVALSAFAFITDCTHGSTRNRAFLITEGVTFLTRILPVLAVGIWLRFYLYTIPLSVCLGLTVIALLYTLFLQPESVESVRNLSLIRQLTRIRVKPLIRIITVFTAKRSENKQQQFIFITIVLILFQTMLLGYLSVFSLYLYGRPFCLDALHVSILSSIKGVLTVILSLTAARIRVAFDKTYLWAILGSFAAITSLIILSLAKTVWLLYIAVCVASLFFITSPVLRTKLTRTIEPNEYAIAFIGAGVVETLGHSGVSAAANAIYNATLDFFPGLVFLIFAITGSIPTAMMCYLAFLERRSSKNINEISLVDTDVVLG